MNITESRQAIVAIPPVGLHGRSFGNSFGDKRDDVFGAPVRDRAEPEASSIDALFQRFSAMMVLMSDRAPVPVKSPVVAKDESEKESEKP